MKTEEEIKEFNETVMEFLMSRRELSDAFETFVNRNRLWLAYNDFLENKKEQENETN